MPETRVTTRGRPAAAEPDAVLATAKRRFLRGERVDVRAIAADLGVSRTTIYTWFGSREGLIAQAVVASAQPLLARCRAEAGGTGGLALVETFDRYNRSLAAAPALRRLIERERDVAMRILTGRDGAVERWNVVAIAQLIEQEVAGGAYTPPIEPRLLAFAVVRLAETFLYTDRSLAQPEELDRLRRIECALLHV